MLPEVFTRGIGAPLPPARLAEGAQPLHHCALGKLDFNQERKEMVL